MTKSTVLVIFMVVLVLGMVAKETQGQERCHEYMTGTGPCEINQCVDQCTAKWKGRGTCMPSSKTCLCTFNCNK
ncbi:hypothetical protein EUTSA_v10003401mg [Eutrema salsugineum]|uniref:Knottin scorpion toxin-like domain-containing protein n=1 Tax=Eutrema salsugineum TaxID=72664 RepID=V4LLS9_EUTSA|nr:defensin-like protein 122 [Eutrema salsugineum]ESQ44694.1 hypothetical protein EUTSA_v10003401mg [Eutrema salsugineum]